MLAGSNTDNITHGYVKNIRKFLLHSFPNTIHNVFIQVLSIKVVIIKGKLSYHYALRVVD